MEHTQKWIARHENDKHWIEDADHIPIANIFDSGEEGKAKAEFIVRACNSYEDRRICQGASGGVESVA